MMPSDCSREAQKISWTGCGQFISLPTRGKKQGCVRVCVSVFLQSVSVLCDITAGAVEIAASSNSRSTLSVGGGSPLISLSVCVWVFMFTIYSMIILYSFV